MPSGDIWHEDTLVSSACRQLAVHSNLAGWSPETRGAQAASPAVLSGQAGDTCSLTASCPEGEGEQMLVAPSVNASHTPGTAVL